MGGTYCSLRIEVSQYSTGESQCEVSAYADGSGHLAADSIEEAIQRQVAESTAIRVKTWRTEAAELMRKADELEKTNAATIF